MSDLDFLSFFLSLQAAMHRAMKVRMTRKLSMDWWKRESLLCVCVSVCVCVSRGMSVFFFFFFLPTDYEEAINIRIRIRKGNRRRPAASAKGGSQCSALQSQRAGQSPLSFLSVQMSVCLCRAAYGLFLLLRSFVRYAKKTSQWLDFFNARVILLLSP